MSVDEMALDEMPVTEMSVDEMPVDAVTGCPFRSFFPLIIAERRLSIADLGKYSRNILQ
jgi:hypothetical protein